MTTTLTIFDCDGVLVDSELLGNRVLRDVIAELGLPLTVPEVLRRFKGRSMQDVWDEVGRAVGHAVPPEVDRDHRARQLAAFRSDLKAVPGAHEVVAALATAFCVASNGPHEKMRVTLGVTGLLPAFEGKIFSRTDVTRAKPFPDLFLHACAAMGATPSTCMVIEDSPLGIEAARRAGISAIGFAGTATADAASLRAAGASTVVHELTELLPLLIEARH